MYFIGDTRDVFTPKVFLGSGCEGKVYYNEDTNEAVKIQYNEINKITSLSEESALRLCNIPTNYILLPRRLVYDENGKYLGYTTTYIPKSKEIEELDVQKYTLKTLTAILIRLYKDAYEVSKYGLCINDVLSEGNYIFNGSYYLIDPGLYYFSEKDKEEILKENISKINTFINYTILWDRIQEIQNKLIERGSNYTICDYLKDEAKEDETLIGLIRRKVK